MLWSKSSDHKTINYALCYAPSLSAGHPGPSGGHLQCDEDSYFLVEAPRFCCRNARITLDGKKVEAKGEVCGDLLAKFQPEEQTWELEGGPTSTGTPEQLETLQVSAINENTPSPLAFEAMKNAYKWSPILGDVCKGHDGTLINWTHSDPPDRAELCPTGSSPVHGKLHNSWSCDGKYTKQVHLHCCTVNGKLRCVHNLVETPPPSECHCMGMEESTTVPLLQLVIVPSSTLQAQRRSQVDCLGRRFL